MCKIKTDLVKRKKENVEESLDSKLGLTLKPELTF